MKRPLLVFLVGVALWCLASAVHLRLGPVELPWAAFRAALWPAAEVPDWQVTIVRDLRLPRVLLGSLVGLALALAGTLMQAVFRNPLAGPGILGVTAAGGFGAVLTVTLVERLGYSGAAPWLVPLAAFLAAVGSTMLALGLAGPGAMGGTGRLLLAGVALSSMWGACTSFLLSIAIADYRVSGQVMYWLLGGLESKTWSDVWVMCLVLPALGGAWLLSRALDALSLGEEHALSVGVAVREVRLTAILLAAWAAALTVAVAGGVGFVGLMVPHVARWFVGGRHRVLLPLAVVLGAALTVSADLVARTAIAPEEMRLGVVTGLLGAPFFLYLLRRERRW